MVKSNRSQVDRFRNRLKRRGVVRVELHVRREDAALVRRVARALADPQREAGARSLLLREFASAEVPDLKALLAAAPLEGVDIERSRDKGRKVEL